MVIAHGLRRKLGNRIIGMRDPANRASSFSGDIASKCEVSQPGLAIVILKIALIQVPNTIGLQEDKH